MTVSVTLLSDTELWEGWLLAGIEMVSVVLALKPENVVSKVTFN